MAEARKLLELADRVEKEAPSIALEREIFEAVFPDQHAEARRKGGERWGNPNDVKAPRYLRSLDAAMTLVPEGYRVWLELNVTFPYAKPHGAWVGGNSSYRENYTRAATPALALTAASLRARAQGEG